MTRPFILAALVLLLAACGQSRPTVSDDPFVQFLSATPDAISAPGQPVTLSWNVLGSYSSLLITADSGISPGAVTGTNTVVYPQGATTYTLTASGLTSSSSADAFVSVSPSGPPTPIPTPEPTEPEGPALEYFVDSSCGELLVTYATVEGGTRQEYRGSGKVYEAFGPFPTSNPFVYISAQNQCDSGYVTVTINRYGEAYLTETSTGPYVIATASGSFAD